MAREGVLVEIDEENDMRWVTCFGHHYGFSRCDKATEFENMGEIEAIMRKDDFHHDSKGYQQFKNRVAKSD